MQKRIKHCDQCHDGEGGCVFPYYGLAPHIHNQAINGTVLTGELPENFSPDDDNGLGIYTHCLNCGGDGCYEDE